MKNPKIAEFRDKITLLKSVATVDDELNRIETMQKMKTVWAAAEVKSSLIETTPAGHRAVLRYTFTVRKQELDFDYLLFKGKILSLLSPYYEVGNKYIVIDAEETIGKKCNIVEFGGMSDEHSRCEQKCC